MTEGISKEDLLKYSRLRLDAEELLDRIIDDCTELDPWIAIDENTPKDCELLLTGNSVKRRFIGYRDSFNLSYYDQDGLCIKRPTHYKLLLPDDPE